MEDNLKKRSPYIARFVQIEVGKYETDEFAVILNMQRMKITVVLSLMVLFSNTLCAQNWQTDFETAKSMAAHEDRPIILVFQGSRV